jgi:hypothetical protein
MELQVYKLEKKIHIIIIIIMIFKEIIKMDISFNITNA